MVSGPSVPDGAIRSSNRRKDFGNQEGQYLSRFLKCLRSNWGHPHGVFGLQHLLDFQRAASSSHTHRFQEREHKHHSAGDGEIWGDRKSIAPRRCRRPCAGDHVVLSIPHQRPVGREELGTNLVVFEVPEIESHEGSRP